MSHPARRHRACLALSLIVALSAAPWLLRRADSVPAALLPAVAVLPCELALAGNHARSLQLPGDLPRHLRLRMACSTGS